ncbi:MAG TPA: NADH-quinone oxidoreductase subunit I [Actinomycetes bacterium]|jgi:NADH-quinone oxidoreductase subunit I
MPALKGVGLIKGLGVTLKTMTRPAATRQYPHVKPNLPARTRGVIALIEENCTVCMLCSRECPDWCIYIDSHKEQVAPKEGGRARTRNILDRFAIDFALCMYCGICVEVCPFDALHWSPEFEYAEHQIERLTHEMDTLRQWAYTVPAPDPLEEGAVEPKELESVRKAREAVAAKAAAAAEEARAAAPAAGAPSPAGDAVAAPSPAGGVVGAPAPAGGAGAGAAQAAPAAPAPTPAQPAAAARPADVEVEPGIDQATYDRLLAAGEPDRTARAKAKAAYMRKAKAEARAAQAAGAPATEAASVETPVAAVAAPETAPPAPSAAGTPEAAEPAPDARDPEARSPEGDPTAAGTAVDVAPGAQTAEADAEHLEIEVDQETYDRLIAAGEPERTARAKAKAAYARKLRAAQRGGSGEPKPSPPENGAQQ